jgi:hypothetical protein
MPVNAFNFAPDDQMELDRRKRLADALQTQASSPIENPMAGGYVTPIHPLQGMAKLAQALSARKAGNDLQERAKALRTQQEERRGADMSLLAQALQGRQASPGGLMEDASGNVTQADPMAGQTPVQSLGQALPMLKDPAMQQAGFSALLGAQTREDTQKFNASQAEENRKARIQERLLQVESAERQAGENRALRAQLATESANLRRELAQFSVQNRPPQQPVAIVGPDGKPQYVMPDQAVGKTPWDKKTGQGLPPSALKMQNELIEDLSIAGSIDADLGKLVQQLAPGKDIKGNDVGPALSVGPVENLISAGRNYIGKSTPNSQNFATFKSSLEKLRNDSLRLNKGVQTEGDAQRAWNEIMANMNDQAVVKRRLEEIQGLNQRASGLKKLQIDTMRANFSMDPFDASQFSGQQSPIGGNPQPYGGPERRASGADPLGLRKK